MTIPNQTDKPRQAAVYRLYDASGVLLYIGSAYDPEHRLKQHRGKPWWSRVARIIEEWHPDRGAAYAAETSLIKAESPEFNRSGTPSHADRCRAAYADWRVRRGYAMRHGEPLNEPAGKLAVEMRRAMAEQRGEKNRPRKKADEE